MVRNVPHADAETITLDTALNGAIQSLWSRRDPITRAAAAAEVADRLNRALSTVAECRSSAVAEATVLPGMSMAKVAEELGIAKSTVAKLAGPADFRQEIAADMPVQARGRLRLRSQRGTPAALTPGEEFPGTPLVRGSPPGVDPACRGLVRPRRLLPDLLPDR
ncbi:MAG TPA: hypothetical protein VNG12_00935 [Acidimicrobiales bacterium]|nr:hypothetical protein [Acidimicrobiales bacterium]